LHVQVVGGDGGIALVDEELLRVGFFVQVGDFGREIGD
jgi:hypothetical protein